MLKQIFNILSEKLGIGEIRRNLAMQRRYEIFDYVEKILKEEKYARRLNQYEYGVYSQGGDDGLIQEIFKRIKHNKFFVEFGVGDGLENNTAFLLLSGWKGLWIEASEQHTKSIEGNPYLGKNLTLIHKSVTSENIENLFESGKVPKEFDLLSIDIDGNDIWVWQAIKNYSPKVVVIEYNGAYGKEVSVSQKYKSDYSWARTKFFGSSLRAIQKVGESKGYTLVACNLLGNNAYFVRNDFADKFEKIDDLYEPFRPFILQVPKYKKTFPDLV